MRSEVESGSEASGDDDDEASDDEDKNKDKGWFEGCAWWSDPNYGPKFAPGMNATRDIQPPSTDDESPLSWLIFCFPLVVLNLILVATKFYM